MEESATEHASGTMRKETPDIAGVDNSTVESWRDLPRDADNDLQWKTPPREQLSTPPLPLPKKKPVTPLKGVLKKSYTPKKGSAQEELAQQLELRSGTLRDASEVLSEMREWRNRKNVDSNPSKPRTPKRRKIGVLNPRHSSKKPERPQPPITTSAPVGYTIAQLYGSPEKAKKQRMMAVAAGEEGLAASVGFVNDADVQLAYQRQLEVIGFDNMKKKKNQSSGSLFSPAGRVSTPTLSQSVEWPFDQTGHSNAKPLNQAKESPFSPVRHTSAQSTPKKVSFPSLPPESDGDSDLSTLLGADTYFNTQQTSGFSPHMLGSSSQRSVGSSAPPSSPFALRPSNGTSRPKHNLVVHNTKELTTALKNLSESPLRRSTNCNGAIAYESSPSPPSLIDLAQNWGEVLIQERAVPTQMGPLHIFVPLDPAPTAVQMDMTRQIWDMVPPQIANQFRVPPTGVDSAWIDAAAAAMFAASSDEMRVEIGLIVALGYSHEKLRMLAAMGVIANWWWMREGLVWTLLQQPLGGGAYKVDDAAVVEQWEFAAGRIQARIVMEELEASVREQ